MEHETPDSESIRETFKECLTSKGLRVTNQRLAIFDAAYGHPDHITAEDLLERAREIDDSVSRATVYRALPILTGCHHSLLQIDLNSTKIFNLD